MQPIVLPGFGLSGRPQVTSNGKGKSVKEKALSEAE